MKVAQSYPALCDPGQNTWGSSQPWDWTQVSCVKGLFFTSWATREVWEIWLFRYWDILIYCQVYFPWVTPPSSLGGVTGRGWGYLPIPSLYWYPPCVPAFLDLISHQWPGAGGGGTDGTREQGWGPVSLTALSYHTLYSQVLPHFPGSSLVILFSMTTSSVVLSCLVWHYRRQLLRWPWTPQYNPLIFHLSWIDSLDVPSLEFLSLEVLGGLDFQISRPPSSAKVPSQIAWSSEKFNSCDRAFWQLGSVWSVPLGDLSSRIRSSWSVGRCVLAFLEQWP